MKKQQTPQQWVKRYYPEALCKKVRNRFVIVLYRGARHIGIYSTAVLSWKLAKLELGAGRIMR